MNRTWICLFVFVCSVVVCPAAWGASVPIVNPSFEDPPYADGAWGEATGWTDGGYYLPDTTTWHVEDWGAGAYNPSAADGYGGTAPDGENVAYTTSYAGYEGGLNQVLSATLQANMQYDLSVLVGNPLLYNGGPTADYRIELLAGGVLLESDTGASPIDDTSWKTASLTYNSGANPAQLGEPLEIRLLAVDFADGYEVDFDTVSLDAVPEPSTVVLLCMGALGLLLFARRKRA